MTRRRVVKLVRDHVAKFIGTDCIVSYEPVGDYDEHVERLRKKLIEEAVEYAFDPSLGEAADVYEALRALAIVDLGSTIHAVIAESMEKYGERGGFTDGTVMVVTSTAPDRHE